MASVIASRVPINFVFKLFCVIYDRTGWQRQEKIFFAPKITLFIFLIAMGCSTHCLASTPAPIISVPAGTLDEPKQVAIAGVTGSTVYVTLDGVTTPSTASPVYVGPIRINYSQTIKAIAVLGAVSSTVSSASYTLDSVRWPAPDPGDASTLKINLRLPTTGIPK